MDVFEITVRTIFQLRRLLAAFTFEGREHIL